MKNKSKYILFILLVIMVLNIKIVNGQARNIDVSLGTFSLDSKLEIASQDGLVIKDRNYNLLDYLGLDRINVSVDGSELVVYDGNFEKARYDLEDVLISSQGESIRLKKQDYRGSIRFIRNNKTIRIINNLDLEDYLYGVVPREMGANFPEEALKAQILASRSFAMSNLNKHKSEGYNLCNTTHCQVYSGHSVENEKINRLVDETRGEYVYYNGKIAETVFHSNNGGYMESAKSAWGSHIDYLLAREDIYSKDTVNSNWTVKISLEDLNKKIENAGIKIGKLEDINILSTTEAGRVSEIELSGSEGREVISGSRFRTIMGNNNFKSTWFKIGGKDVIISKDDIEIFIRDRSGVERLRDNIVYIEGARDSTRARLEDLEIYGLKKNQDNNKEKVPSELIFEGRGFGHGVGMSQYGAKTMAEKGYNYIEILEHYYDGTDIY